MTAPTPLSAPHSAQPHNKKGVVNYGSTAMEFGGLCKDKEVVLVKTLNEDGTESVASKETGADIYSLSFLEFFALNTAAIQALKQEVTALKVEINTMKKGDAET